MKRVLLVGTGPSGFAVLSTLPSFENIWIMDGPNEYSQSDTGSSKHLGLKNKFGSSHMYARTQELFVDGQDSHKLPISHSRGGFGEVWGNGFVPYQITDYDPGFQVSSKKVQEAMKELLRVIPFTHIPSDLDLRFGNISTYCDSGRYQNPKLHSNFLQILKKKEHSKFGGSLLFGPPNTLLDSSSCTKCGLCLTGCPYGALFDPGEKINEMFYRGQIPISRQIKGILRKLQPLGSEVRVTYSDGGLEKEVLFDEVILSTGPLSTATILVDSHLLPNSFEVPDSQVFYSALFSRRRFKAQREIQQVGQIVCYPKEHIDADFQASFYAPSELSRSRLAGVLMRNPRLDQLIPSSVSERIIPVIGFLPQSKSGAMVIKKTSKGISIERLTNPVSRSSSISAVKQILRDLRGLGIHGFSRAVIVPPPGSGFHLGASLPLGSEYVDNSGYLRNSRSIRILDASLLPKIPAGAHTFLSMALIRALLKDSK